MHLDENAATRLLHGELPLAEAAKARAHLGECAACRSDYDVLAAEEERVLAALRRLDHPSAPITAQVVISGVTRPLGWRRWAAVGLLGVGLAGAAFAFPGSPLRRWVSSWAPAPVAPPPAVPEVQAGSPAPSGIAVEAGARLVIEVTGADSGSRLIVRLGERPQVTVQAPAGTASFTSGVGRLGVAVARSPAEVEVEIPVAAPWVEILVGSRRVFLKDGGRLIGAGSLVGSGPFSFPIGG